MLRDILEIQAYAHTVCANASVKTGKNFRALFSDTKTAKTYERGNTVYIELPKPTMQTTDEEYILNRHFVIHEILHHTEGPTVAKTWTENKLPIDDKNPLWNLCMAAEDYRIEHIGSSKYRGDAKSINTATGMIIEKYIDRFSNLSKQEKEGLANNKYGAGILAAMLVNIEARHPWAASTITPRMSVLKNAMPKEVMDNYKKLMDAGYDETLLDMSTEQGAVDAGKTAYKIMFDEDPEDQCKQQPKPQDGDGSGGSEEGQGKAQAKAGQGQQDPSEGKNAGKVVPGFTDSGKEVEYKKLLLTDHTSDEGSGTGVNFKYDPKTMFNGDTFEPTPYDKLKIADYSDKALSSKIPRHYSLVPPDDKLSRKFANKVRRLLQVRSQARYLGGQTKGKINRKQLFRVGCPTVGNGEWNSKVFKKRFEDDVLDTTIQLVVDSSGSMSGIKYQTACNAAILLNEAFERTLHMPVEIITFSESGSGSAFGIIKKAGARITQKEIVNNFALFADRYMGSNSDGEAIQFAARRLRLAKTKRKIMIVLSDGSPASGRRGSEALYTKETIKEIINEGAIEIYGIGIKNKSVEHFYPEYKVVDNIKELESSILKVIKYKLNV